MIDERLSEFVRLNSWKFRQYRGQKGVSWAAPSVIYYIKLKVFKRYVYKLGVTSRTVDDRIKEFNLPAFVTVERVWISEPGRFIKMVNIEKNFHRLMKRHRDWTSAKESMFLLASGNSEVYKVDVLGLDKEEVG
jgi:hypothetical protein